MKEALVLMAKAPRPGEVKTRLAGALGAEDAAELYVAFLNDTWAAMEEVWEEREGLSLALCYTPAGAEEAFERLEREGGLMLAQRGESLGERMQNCFADLFAAGFESVVLIGADTPTLPADALGEALERLAEGGENRVVVGPSEDGGYYLIGMRRLHAALFAGVNWGAGGVFAETERRAQTCGVEISLLPAWYDVDTPADLERLRREVTGGPATEVEARHTRAFLKALAKREA
jgi:uncharacterized protein